MAGYALVKFIDENGITVVPQCWLKNNHCFWPPYKTDGVTKAVKAREMPQDKWELYPVNVLKKYGKLIKK